MPAAPVSCPKLCTKSPTKLRNNQEPPKAKSTALAEWKLLSKPSSAMPASRYYSFAPAQKTPVRGWAGAEGGIQTLCTSQVKTSEAGEASAAERKQQTFLLESSSCILKYIYIFSASRKRINVNFKKSFQSYNFALIFLLRKKSGMWEEMLIGVSDGVMVVSRTRMWLINHNIIS